MADNKWNDWGRGDDLMGVICKTSGNITKTESQRVMGIQRIIFECILYKIYSRLF